MSLQKLIANYAAYNLWSNEKLAAHLRTLPQEALYQEVPSSFNSIAKTLNHILATDEYWYSVITGSGAGTKRWGVSNPEAEEVLAALVSQSELTKQVVQSFSDEDLSDILTIDEPWCQASFARYEFIQHALNHSTYHRGQIITMCRVLGFTDLPNTDYNFFNVAMVSRPVLQ